MSSDVYFNEPGIDLEKGTGRGTKLNIGYQNIVKYGTVKYAMVEML